MRAPVDSFLRRALMFFLNPWEASAVPTIQALSDIFARPTMTLQNPPDLSHSRPCNKCGRIIAPNYLHCVYCQDQRLRLWKEPREHLLPHLKRHLEGGKPFFIASSTILLSVILYLLLLA